MRQLRRAPPWWSSRAEQMPHEDERYETAKWRTLWLMVGFAVLVGVGIVTVLRPELEDEPDESVPAEMGEIGAGEGPEADHALQE